MTDDWGDNPYTCRICHTEDCVPASGNKNSPILVVGEQPGKEEIKKGKPLVGNTGTIFKMELARIGIDLNRLRICNLWHHDPKGSTQFCLQEGVSRVLEEAKGKEAILLVGSETVTYFCNENVSDVSGMIVHSHYLSAPIVFACVQPATVFHGGLGELRLSLEKFGELIKEILL